MFLSKIISIFSSPKDVSIDRTKINGKLYEFINSKVIPGTDLSKEEFWKNFVKAANELAPKNRELLKKREELQCKLDEWHKVNKDNFLIEEYKKFLK